VHRWFAPAIMGNDSMTETPREKYERLRKAVQEAILTDYPNLDRVGCPVASVVREVASREELTKDAVWEHITHCSPCYRLFLKFKEECRQARGETA
jgi:hypothetical protein